MATNLMNLPVNIPWKLIAASSHMMDTHFGDDHFPHPWQSSLAIYAYESNPQDLDEALCDQRITFFKVSCSITGFQPVVKDMERIEEDNRYGITYDDIDKIIQKYCACYGVLLNVAVFPNPTNIDVKDYPHIIEFEPKKRDLYQAATENAEILTASRSAVSTNKSFTSTDSCQTGLDLGANITNTTGKEVSGDAAGVPVGVKEQTVVGANAKGSHKWGSVQTDSNNITIDSSRERRETNGTVTNLTQMYNLLTGYHVGTNRAAFLMLPRPHNLQPTKYRTFVQGVRQIEGVQDFFLVVSRPSTVESLCIETSLFTGHFDEDVQFVTPQVQYEHTTKLYEVNESVRAGWDKLGNTKSINRQYEVLPDDGWEIDFDKGDDGHHGVSFEFLSRTVGTIIESHDYQVTPAGQLTVTATITCGWKSSSEFHCLYTVHLKRPIGDVGVAKPVTADLLVQQFRLFSCICIEEDCIKITDPTLSIDRDFSPRLLDGSIEYSGVLGFNKVNNQMQNRLSSSSQKPFETWHESFINTDYFKNKFKLLIPQNVLQKKVAEIDGLSSKVVDILGQDCTISDILNMDFKTFVRKTGLDIKQAGIVRSLILGLPQKES